MQYYNEIYEQKFAPGLTIVVGFKEECIEITNYLNSFDKKVDCYIDVNTSTLEPIIKQEDLNEISLNSYIILGNETIDISIFREAGLSLIYVYKDNAIERFDKINVTIEDDIFKYTNRVTFELSNMCGYAHIHKKCPLSLETEHKTLSTEIIHKVLDTMHDYKYDGVISFHRYNEPLMDPRLIDLVKYARAKCPDSDIFILTNGYYLTQNIMNDLANAGVTLIDVTGYTIEEFERLSTIKTNIAYRIFSSKFDDRLGIYEYNNKRKDLVPCFWPLNDLIITRDGEVGLCHFDWKSKYKFGSLEKISLKDIILNSEIVEIYKNNAKGNRRYELCQNCKNATRTPDLSFFYSNIFFKPSAISN